MLVFACHVLSKGKHPVADSRTHTKVRRKDRRWMVRVAPGALNLHSLLYLGDLCHHLWILQLRALLDQCRIVLCGDLLNLLVWGLLVQGFAIVEDRVESQVIWRTVLLYVLVDLTSVCVNSDQRLRHDIVWLVVLGDTIALSLVLYAVKCIEQCKVIRWILVVPNLDLISAVGALQLSSLHALADTCFAESVPTLLQNFRQSLTPIVLLEAKLALHWKFTILFLTNRLFQQKYR